jgi:hypothetical protein
MKHIKVIEKVFAHPTTTNLDWKELEHALTHYGADIEITKANKAKIIVNDKETVIGLPHHGHTIESKDEINQIRHFLEEAGLTPESLK